jgi:hypothetical protein
MFAGTAEIDITPKGSAWMDGMIRSHRSTGVHDRLRARALYLAPGTDPETACVLVGMDVVGLSGEDALEARRGAEKATGIPLDRIVLAASHTHSGPATIGYFNPRETEYVRELVENLIRVIQRAASTVTPAAVGCASGKEDTISHYRRLLAQDGHVVMNWEPYPADRIVGPLGQVDPELGVLKVMAQSDARYLCIAFNHAGHPNVLSGDNYVISADYPGLASQLLEEKFGCPAMFLNGAQGTMDIDGLRDRDWEGRQRIGTTLAEAVGSVVSGIPVSPAVRMRSGSVRYGIPSRRISGREYAWAVKVLAETGGKVQALPDGVGDDFKAKLFRELRDRESADNPVEQICVALDDSALISFPGELFTEIGQEIKRESPFGRTYIIGLANGSVGYVPTRQAISQGGYEVETRRLNDSAAETIVERSLSLLREVHSH